MMNVTFAFGEEGVEFDRRGDPPGRLVMRMYIILLFFCIYFL